VTTSSPNIDTPAVAPDASVTWQPDRDALVAKGWAKPAAEAVARLNQPLFDLLREADPALVERQLNVLARLSHNDAAQATLVDHPELAGLLAGSLDADTEGPDLILRTLPRLDSDWAAVSSIYTLAADPETSVARARLLARDGDLVRRLWQRDAWSLVSSLETLPPSDPARSVYRTWVQSILTTALDSPADDALDRAQTLLTIHAPTVMSLVVQDPDFQTRLLNDIWPLFARTLEDHQGELEWGTYLADPAIWSFLKNYGQRGQILFNHCGPVALDLLTCPEYKDIRSQVFDTLDAGDQTTITALLDPTLRAQPLFLQLLKRNLPPGTRASAIGQLMAQPANAPYHLQRFAALSDQALTEELGPPPSGPVTWLPGYSLYEVVHKLSQGRDVTGLDTAFAAVDVAEGVFMLKGASRGLKAVQVGLKNTLEKQGALITAQKIEKATARELYPWVLRQAYSSARSTMAAARRALCIDVTQAVRLAFQQGGLGRATFKRLTDLEARVFMRQDRRVLIDLSALVAKNHVVGRYLRETAVNAGVDLGLQTRPSQAAIAGAVATASLTTDQLDAWRRHVAAWWLANATGLLDQAVAIP
jgi:hypothetical protein